jgi:hypothetical protein
MEWKKQHCRIYSNILLTFLLFLLTVLSINYDDDCGACNVHCTVEYWQMINNLKNGKKLIVFYFLPSHS